MWFILQLSLELIEIPEFRLKLGCKDGAELIDLLDFGVELLLDFR